MVVARLLGWDPQVQPLGLIAAVLAGTAAFAGLGLALAGVLSGPANLAACNGLYLLLLLLGGVAVPASELPAALGEVARTLPSGALVDVMVDVTGGPASARAWLVLLGLGGGAAHGRRRHLPLVPGLSDRSDLRPARLAPRFVAGRGAAARRSPHAR